MKYKLLTVFVTGLLFLSLSNFVSAENVYRWEDANGRVFFGPKPPTSAKNKKQIKKTTISRYSTEQMLKGLGTRGRLDDQDISLKEENIPLDEPEEETPELPVAELSVADIDFEENAAKELKRCDAVISNTGKLPAEAVSISFAFADGSLVPAVGPSSIAPNSEAVYSIPDSALPLKLQFDSEDSKTINLEPEVRIDFEGKKP